MKYLIAVLSLLLVIPAVAANKQPVNVQVVSSDHASRSRTWTAADHSGVNGGIGVHSVRGSDLEIIFVKTVIDGHNFELRCAKQYRSCIAPEAGTYSAQRDGDQIWLPVTDPKGKQREIKYHIVGGW